MSWLRARQRLQQGLATLIELTAIFALPVISAMRRQRRRRVFIVAYHESTDIYQSMKARCLSSQDSAWLSQTILNDAFPGVPRNPLDGAAPALTVSTAPFDEQLQYRPLSSGKSRFANCGVMLDGTVRTFAVDAAAITDFTNFTGQSSPLTLGDIVRKTGPVPTSFYITRRRGKMARR
jgi:DNA (cytosine-5)-methyltransferase 1